MTWISTVTRSMRNSSGLGVAGFVLIELLVVMSLIALIAAVAFPNLLPALSFGQLEGSARHLSSFGQQAMAHCVLMRERLTVRIDLDEQEYWCVRWPEPPGLFDEDDEDGEDEGDAEKKEDEGGGLFDLGMTPATLGELDEEMLAEKAVRMQENLDRFAQMSLRARSRNARRESIMDEFGPLFDEEFTLDIGDDDEAEVVVLPLLNRARLREDVRIETVVVSGTEHEQGRVDVDLSPLGLSEPVLFYLKNADEDYYTVEWDPITGGAYVYEGKETFS